MILLYNFEAAIFRGIGNTKLPFIALVISGIVNVGLNLFFVLILRRNVDGVAIATSLSEKVLAEEGNNSHSFELGISHLAPDKYVLKVKEGRCNL